VGVKGAPAFISPLTPTDFCATHFESFKKSYNNLTPSKKATILAFSGNSWYAKQKESEEM